MVSIKEYLLSKQKPSTAAQMKFPVEPDFENTVDFLENNDFERIDKCPELMSDLIKDIESGRKYTIDISLSPTSPKDLFFIAFGDGEVSNEKPLFSMYIYKDNPRKNFYIENYDLQHTKYYKEFMYKEFVKKVNNTFGW